LSVERCGVRTQLDCMRSRARVWGHAAQLDGPPVPSPMWHRMHCWCGMPSRCIHMPTRPSHARVRADAHGPTMRCRLALPTARLPACPPLLRPVARGITARPARSLPRHCTPQHPTASSVRHCTELSSAPWATARARERQQEGAWQAAVQERWFCPAPQIIAELNHDVDYY